MFIRSQTMTLLQIFCDLSLFSFTLRAAKRGLKLFEIFQLQKQFLENIEGEMSIRSQTTTLLQIFCELSLFSQFIFKSMREADDPSTLTLEC